MRGRLIAACVLVSSLAAFAGGVLFEHYVGTDAVMDWTGLRYAWLMHQSRSTADRKALILPVATTDRTMVALVFGQSNAGNGGETAGPPHPGAFEFYRGHLFEARDPLLGATGDGGSIWLRLAGKVVASGAYDRVILVPFSFGPSTVARFAPGGSLNAGLLATIADARANGLQFTHLLWVQGEADAMAHTPGPVYREKFDAMLASIRHEGVAAPIFVARATRCAKFRPSDEIGNAQSALVDPGAGILAGPDLDQLGLADRYDGCHFSTEGLDRAAALWLAAIEADRERRHRAEAGRPLGTSFASRPYGVVRLEFNPSATGETPWTSARR